MPKFSLRVACLFKGMSLKSIIYPSIYEYLLYAWMKQNEFTINCARFLKKHTHLIMLIQTCAPCKAVVGILGIYSKCYFYLKSNTNCDAGVVMATQRKGTHFSKVNGHCKIEICDKIYDQVLRSFTTLFFYNFLRPLNSSNINDLSLNRMSQCTCTLQV